MMRAYCGVLIVLVILACPMAHAVPAAPVEVTLQQPDGSTFTAKPRGDEFANWMETLDGHTVVKSNGTWYYAQKAASGQLEASPNKVGALSTKSLSSLPLHLSPPIDPRAFEVHTPRSLASGSGKALVHTQYILTVIVNYSNISAAYPDSAFQSLVYGSSGSVKDFFLENSYDNFTVAPAAETYGTVNDGTVNDGVVHVTRPVNHPNFGGNLSGTPAEAAAIMTAADPYVDFASFDSNSDGSVSSDELAIVMILAGYEASYYGTYTPSVWGHAWSLSSPAAHDGVYLQPYTMFGERQGSDTSHHQATIGIMCHELGHLMLLLPDLYDTDDSSEGVGEWSLMGSGSWNYSGGYQGNSPAHLDAWCKTTLGMVTPTDITATTTGATILQGSSNASIMRLWVDKYKLGESFLLENRQLSGYDAGLPSNGLLIWHVDENQTSNDDETHKLVDLEEADGLPQMDTLVNRGDAGDPYPGSTANTTFNNTSTPDSKDYNSAATGVAITGISASAASMTANLVPSTTGGTGGYVRYDEKGVSGFAGMPSTVFWTAMRVTNNTSMDTLDGIDVYISDSVAAVNFYLYSTIPGGVPTTLLYSQTGLVANKFGWNRFLLNTPQSFPPSSDRVIVLQIWNQSFAYPAAYDGEGADSGRCYYDDNGSGAFAALGNDLNQIPLLSLNSPAVSSIVRADSSPTNATSVNFTVTFNSSVTGVGVNDFVLTTSGITGASVTSVSTDSGATRTVTVNTGSGSGTIRLDVDDDDSIISGSSTPLGGTGAGNGDYTSGEVYTIDKTPPTAPTVTGTTPTRDTTPTWSWTAGGGGNGTFRYQLDSGSWIETTATSYTPPIALSETVHTLNVQERDAVGNWSTSGTLAITVDLDAIALEIGAPSTTLTKNGPVTYTVTYYSAASVTLDSSDITLVKTGTANASVGVSGPTGVEPKTCTVTLSSVTGTGTLGISIAAGTATDASMVSAPAAGPSATFTADNTKPVITLVGANPIVIGRGATYTDAGATATDNIDGNITGSILINASAVDTSTVGTYLVSFNVTDAAGNSAVTVYRTVNVLAALPLDMWPLAAVLMLVALITVRRVARARQG